MTGDGVVLETDRLWLRPWRVTEAAIKRELWTERDPRVPVTAGSTRGINLFTTRRL